jgi:hypothetical protein
MAGLIELELKEEEASFTIQETEDVCFTLQKDEVLSFSMETEREATLVLAEELCIFSLILNNAIEKNDNYEPLYCSDGMLHAADGNPIYVLKWRIETN